VFSVAAAFRLREKVWDGATIFAQAEACGYIFCFSAKLEAHHCWKKN
jgi:hypothetical protein